MEMKVDRTKARLLRMSESDDSGFVEGTPEALANGLTRVLLDDGLREKLSGNAVEWIKRFNWKKTTEEFLEMIIKVV